MRIEEKSNRGFIVKLAATFAIIFTVCAILCTVTMCIEKDLELLWCVIFFWVFASVFAIVAIVAKFYSGRRYVFTDSQIMCYKRKTLLEIIEIADVENIKFYKYKFRYIIPIFIADVENGGCWSLHVHLKNGTQKTLRFFNVKQAVALKEQIFGEKMTII